MKPKQLKVNKNHETLTDYCAIKFFGGAENQWSAKIDGDEMIDISIPVPDGFRINKCSKNP